jgi:hypothetical protein
MDVRMGFRSAAPRGLIGGGDSAVEALVGGGTDWARREVLMGLGFVWGVMGPFSRREVRVPVVEAGLPVL